MAMVTLTELYLTVQQVLLILTVKMPQSIENGMDKTYETEAENQGNRRPKIGKTPENLLVLY